MENLYIPPTDHSPEIKFDYSIHALHINGESYPENAMAFYAPVRASLEHYLTAAKSEHPLQVNVALRYFNSSSTKLIRSLMGMLDGSAKAGRKVVTYWHHDPEDDMMMEFGADLQDEFKMMEVHLVPLN